ncbi:ABC transporter permease [Erythrobacter sp. JK5]|uniref:ABC transporter permease n=1 Tax=Erythrobacter sp. JK5 TaxID=2829500 RepID=UPI001BA4E8C1|nr:ABC transporter permease [Erythrobacter sp. JK5]QUL37157.1 ABC transporter permease [Erythrobacter sp. JK5]
MSAVETNPRLSRLEAAWVIARRDFIAVLFSRAFLFFLIGPLFPVLVGGLAGSIGKQTSAEAVSIEVGLAMSAQDNAAMLAARNNLAEQFGRGLPEMRAVPEAQSEADFDPRAFLEQRRGNYVAIVTGTPQAPQLVGTQAQVDRWKGSVGLIAATVSQSVPARFPEVAQITVAASAAADRTSRIRTAQAAQMVLFLLTMLLGGMVLSNLAEEKGNKIIEILAAAVPMDAVFMGKLFAMLGVSFVGIAVWGMVGWGFWSLAEDAIVTVTQTNFSELPGPAVGWPMFVALGIVYFSMAYLLLGSLFLTIGSMASSVREVQTLSMPVTMMQLMVFFLAMATVTDTGSGMELFAAIFPLSSPFAMLARAALQETLWIHAAALAWQAAAVVLLVKGGSLLFRKRVMKSGGAGRAKKRRWTRSSAGRDAEVQPAE